MGNKAGQEAGKLPDRRAEPGLFLLRGFGLWSLPVLTPRSAHDAFLCTCLEGRGAETRFSDFRTPTSVFATVTSRDEGEGPALEAENYKIVKQRSLWSHSLLCPCTQLNGQNTIDTQNNIY